MDTIPTILPYRGGPDDTATVLAFEGRTFHVGYVPEGEQGRKIYGGPLIPGPWAYVFGLPFAITEQGEPGKQPDEPVPIYEGALLRVCGQVYRVRIASLRIELDPA
jgi:hypothetical protein